MDSSARHHNLAARERLEQELLERGQLARREAARLHATAGKGLALAVGEATGYRRALNALLLFDDAAAALAIVRRYLNDSEERGTGQQSALEAAAKMLETIAT